MNIVIHGVERLLMEKKLEELLSRRDESHELLHG